MVIGGFFELENDRMKEAYYRERLFTYYLLNIHIQKEHRIKSPTDFMPFEWEDSYQVTPEVEVLTTEEIQKRFDKMDRAMKQKYG